MAVADILLVYTVTDAADEVWTRAERMKRTAIGKMRHDEVAENCLKGGGDCRDRDGPAMADDAENMIL